MKTPTKKELEALAVEALGEVSRMAEWGYGKGNIAHRAIHLVMADSQEVRIVAANRKCARIALAAALRALAEVTPCD